MKIRKLLVTKRHVFNAAKNNDDGSRSISKNSNSNSNSNSNKVEDESENSVFDENENRRKIKNENEKVEDEIYTGAHAKGRNVYVYIASDNEEVKEALVSFLGSYHPQIRGSDFFIFILSYFSSL